jgi:hypothetical protein
MNDSQIDKAILATTGTAWTKVSMVIVKTAGTQGISLPEGEDGYIIVARRIESLVHDGQLAAQGDIKKWRHSEVRLPKKGLS